MVMSSMCLWVVPPFYLSFFLYFNRFLICLFCLEGVMLGLFISLFSGVSFEVGVSFMFFMTTSVSAAAIGLGLVVILSRSYGSFYCSGGLMGRV